MDRLSVERSESANTGTAPISRMGYTLVDHVKAGTITFDFGGKGLDMLGLERIAKAIKLAEEPELTMIALLTPTYFANDSSNSRTFSPIVN
jgi:hypothetical protein